MQPRRSAEKREIQNAEHGRHDGGHAQARRKLQSPVFGLTEISIAQGWGLAAIVSFLTHQFDFNKSGDDSDKAMVTRAVAGFLHPIFALLSGWLATLFL